MTPDQMAAELRKKLDPKHIKPAPQGKYGDYVDGYHVISEANRIFGEFGWSYEVTRLERVSEQTVDTSKGPQVRVGYLCSVKVTVGDTYREGVAVGSGMGSPNSLADHHESAAKEAETDAVKRALRTFGNTFGLALYDKTRANVGTERDPEAVANALIAAMRKRTDIIGLIAFLGGDKFCDPAAWLRANHPEHGARVDTEADNLRNALNTEDETPFDGDGK